MYILPLPCDVSNSSNTNASAYSGTSHKYITKTDEIARNVYNGCECMRQPPLKLHVSKGNSKREENKKDCFVWKKQQQQQ